MSYESLFNLLGFIVVTFPALLVAELGLSALVGRPLSESATSKCTQFTVVSGLLCSVAILALMLFSGHRQVNIELGNWVVIAPEDFHFHVKFVFDRLSVPFVILSYLLVGTIGAFANQYLHREPGYSRFFLLYALFLLGMIVATLAGTIEVLFLGWELVGLSSALLVAYFHERQAPVINGQRVWSVYRVADAAFLVAALLLHHLTGEGEFSKLMGAASVGWPDGRIDPGFMTAGQAFLIGLLLVIAAAGKSALIPFSGWLPRAMEGPTPSSAVFYGALSVHLGAYLLLRVSPILDMSPCLSAVVVLLGVSSAIYGALVARVQADVKSALAFASLTQVGIITAEIGIGLRYIALIHIIGHACLRTLQLVRAPTLLHDYHQLENAIGDHLHQESGPWERLVPPRIRLMLYRLSLDRGSFDTIIDEFIVRPFVMLFRWCDAMERRWTDWLTGNQSRESNGISALSPRSEDADVESRLV